MHHSTLNAAPTFNFHAVNVTALFALVVVVEQQVSPCSLADSACHGARLPFSLKTVVTGSATHSSSAVASTASLSAASPLFFIEDCRSRALRSASQIVPCSEGCHATAVVAGAHGGLGHRRMTAVPQDGSDVTRRRQVKDEARRSSRRAPIWQAPRSAQATVCQPTCGALGRRRPHARRRRPSRTESAPSRTEAATSEEVCLDLAAKVPDGAEEEEDIDRGERVVDGRDEEAVEREDEPGQSQCRILRQRDLLGRPMQIAQ